MTGREMGTIKSFAAPSLWFRVIITSFCFILNTEGFQFSQLMITLPFYCYEEEKPKVSMVLFFHCVAALSHLTAGKDLRMNVFFLCFFILILLQENRLKCVSRTSPGELLPQNNGFAQSRTKTGLFLSGGSSAGILPLFHVERYHGPADRCGPEPAMHHNSRPRSSTSSLPACSSSGAEVCSGKSEMKCQERSDCLGTGDPN